MPQEPSTWLVAPSPEEVRKAEHEADDILAGRIVLPRRNDLAKKKPELASKIPVNLITTFEEGVKDVLQQLHGHGATRVTRKSAPERLAKTSQPATRQSPSELSAELLRNLSSELPGDISVKRIGLLADRIRDAEAELAASRTRLNMTYYEVVESTNTAAAAHNRALVDTVGEFMDLRDFLSKLTPDYLGIISVLDRISYYSDALTEDILRSLQAVDAEKLRIIALTRKLRDPPHPTNSLYSTGSHGEITAGFEKVFGDSLREHGGAMIGDLHGDLDILKWLGSEMQFMSQSNVGFIGLEMFEAKDQKVLDAFQDPSSGHYRDKSMLVNYLNNNRWGGKGPGWVEQLADTATKAVDKKIRLVALDTDAIPNSGAERIEQANPAWELQYRKAKQEMPNKYGVIFGGQAHASQSSYVTTPGVDKALGIDSFDVFLPDLYSGAVRWDIRPGPGSSAGIYYNPSQVDSKFTIFPPHYPPATP